VQLNKTQLSELLGCSLPTVDAKVRRGMPFKERGRRGGKDWVFDSAEVVEWERQQAVMNSGGSGAADEDELKRRKLAAETGKAELELAKAKGEVATLADVEKAIARAFAEVRIGMRNVPQRVVVSLIGEQNETRIKRILLDEIDQVLQSLADTEILAEDDEPPVQ